jgi:hypothetical protein
MVAVLAPGITTPFLRQTYEREPKHPETLATKLDVEPGQNEFWPVIDTDKTEAVEACALAVKENRVSAAARKNELAPFR